MTQTSTETITEGAPNVPQADAEAALISISDHLKRYDARSAEGLPIVASAPGGGWMVAIHNGDGEKVDTCRVIAWTVHENGGMVPCCVEDPSEGTTWFPTLAPESKTRVYHPDDERTDES